MRTTAGPLVLLGALVAAGAALGAPRVRVVELSVSSPGPEARPAEGAVVPWPLRLRAAPDLTPASLVVNTSDAPTLEEDEAVLVTEKLARGPVRAIGEQRCGGGRSPGVGGRSAGQWNAVLLGDEANHDHDVGLLSFEAAAPRLPHPAARRTG